MNVRLFFSNFMNIYGYQVYPVKAEAIELEKPNPYEPPETDGRRLSNDDGVSPRSKVGRGTLFLLRVVAAWHAVFAVIAITYPVFYARTLFLVLEGSRTAPWIFKLEAVASASFWTVIAGLSMALALGLARIRSWCRFVAMMFLFVYTSLLTINIIIESPKNPTIFVIAITAMLAIPMIPILVLFFSKRLAFPLNRSR